MLATDIAPNRLERAKLAALELMQEAGTDRMGLVAFAGDAFLECPLTIDNTAFQQSVQALDVNSIPQGGTALAAAINTALTAFKENNHYKVLVLFTDGEDNDDRRARSGAERGESRAENLHHRHRHGGGRSGARDGCERQFGLRPRRAGQCREVAS